MIHMTIIMEDTVLIATRDILHFPEREPETLWTVIVTDALTGKTMRAEWTDAQLAAIIALMQGVGENENAGFDAIELYRIAEPLVADWPSEVRPIP